MGMWVGFGTITCDKAQDSIIKNEGKIIPNGNVHLHIGEHSSIGNVNCSVCKKFWDQHPGKGFGTNEELLQIQAKNGVFVNPQ